MRRGLWHKRLRGPAYELSVVAFASLLTAGMLWGTAEAERIIGDEVLVSGEPVGVGYHWTWSSGQRGVAVSGDSVFVVWRGAGPLGEGVYLSRSLDGGETFESPCRVNDLGIPAYQPSLAISPDGELCVTWTDKRDGDGPTWNIYFSKSVDGGESFGPDVRVDDAGNGSSRQTQSAVAVDDSGRIYAVWLDGRGNEGTLGVYSSRSLDGGETFEPNLELPNPEEGGWPQHGPGIAATGNGRVYVSCVDSRHIDNGPPMVVCVRHSVDAGATFSEQVDIDSCGLWTQRTSIAVAGSLDVYVAWVYSEDYPMLATSGDGGLTFGAAVQVTDRAGCCSQDNMCVSLSVNSTGCLAVAWKDSFNVIGIAESRDMGETFLPTVLLEGPGDRDYATVAIDDKDSVYIAWTDYRHGDSGDIYLSKGVLNPPAGIQDLTDRGSIPDFVRVGPNPFSSQITFQFVANDASRGVSVYDISGKLVRHVYGRSRFIEWDGRHENGRRVTPGVYFVTSRTGGSNDRIKIILAR
jgi:hypothetical protein